MCSNASIPGARRTSDSLPVPRVWVTTAAEALARDNAAIAQGTSGFALMLNAGTRAAEFILREYAAHLAHGVAVFAGGGNNGGDAYIVAAQLARAGVSVRLSVAAPPRTPDAIRAAALATAKLRVLAPSGREGLVVDGLLGTGHRGELRGDIRERCDAMQQARTSGAVVIALDLPSGLDANSGTVSEGSVAAHATVSFGTIKRGTLIARGHCGAVSLVDIGLGEQDGLSDAGWRMLDDDEIAHRLPTMAWNAHKGQRGQLALLGGTSSMAGALVLAARAALGGGCGLVRCYSDSAGVAVLQQAVPQAIARVCPVVTGRSDTVPWGSALAVGPGLGVGDASMAMLRIGLMENPGLPLLLDADALNLVSLLGEGNAASALRAFGEGRPAVVCTPHPREFARLIGMSSPATGAADNWQERAERLRSFAVDANAVMLLKGPPTLVATPDGAPVTVLARGTALLATGGSGDLLTGLIGALIAQHVEARDAVLLGATAHGVAAEIATQRAQGVRGVPLDAVLDALPETWRRMRQPPTFPDGELLRLPAPWNNV